MNVRPLRLLGATTLCALEAAVTAIVAAWAADWGIDPAPTSCRCEAADRAGGRPDYWRQGWTGANATAWIDWPAHAAGEIERAMFSLRQLAAPSRAGDPEIAPAAADAALDALTTALAEGALGGGPRAPLPPGRQPDAEWRPWSGAVLARVTIGHAALCCLMDAEAVRRHPSTPIRALPATTPLDKLDMQATFGPVPLALPVKLGEVRVDLASLMTVGVGDVIRLDVALSRRLEVLTPDGKPLFAAHLGRDGDRVAIEVAASL